MLGVEAVAWEKKNSIPRASITFVCPIHEVFFMSMLTPR